MGGWGKCSGFANMGATRLPLYTWGHHRESITLPSRRECGEQQAGGPRCPTLPHLPLVISSCKSGYRDVCAPPCLGLCPQLWVFLCILGAQSQTCAFPLGRGRRTGGPSTGDQELRAAEVPVLAQTAFPSPTQLPDRAVLSEKPAEQQSQVSSRETSPHVGLRLRQEVQQHP